MTILFQILFYLTGSEPFSRYCSSSNIPPNKDETKDGPSLPPEVPSTCCASGCASCVWLDYAEEVVKYYEHKAEKLSCDQLLKEVEANIQEINNE